MKFLAERKLSCEERKEILEARWPEEIFTNIKRRTGEVAKAPWRGFSSSRRERNQLGHSSRHASEGSIRQGVVCKEDGEHAKGH